MLPLLLLLLPGRASAADLTVGALSPNLKVRPSDTPTTKPSIALEAARNEFESFQIVLRGGAADVAGVSAKIGKPLTGPGGAKIPDPTLYVARYYDVGTASNDEGASGPWPDPLVPDVDTYFGEKRNAFPLTVPAGKTRVIWVDVLVPPTQTPGDYAGEIEIDVGGAQQATIPVSLHVGTFALPSTATLASAFGMGWNAPSLAHCPGTAFPYCGDSTGVASVKLRALYLRAALEHRFTVSDTDFQPPFGSDQKPWEEHVLPLIDGTAPSTRLPGAKLTVVRIDDGDAQLKRWIDYAKLKGFFDRLVYYPVDEPGTTAAQWAKFKTSSDALHAIDPNAQILITSSIDDATSGGATDKVDVFVPVLDQLENRSGAYAGDQRPKYDAWLAAKPSRRIWAYQSCDQHGCGSCGTPSPGVEYTGWPNRVIDSSAVQDRAFPWQAFRYRVSGELYFETTHQLVDAWKPNGQCAFSGSGDGTLFYPGTPGGTYGVGGTKDIPIESIRMKMIREGMEDYEYLVLAAKKDATKAKAIADALFPKSYESAKTPDALEKARHELFAMLDEPSVPGDDAGPIADGGVPDAATGDDAGAIAATPSTDDGGCGCRTTNGRSPSALLLLGVLLFGTRARRATLALRASVTDRADRGRRC